MESAEDEKKKEKWIKQTLSNALYFPAGMEKNEDWKRSYGYLFVLYSTKGVVLPNPEKGNEYELKYIITLYHKEHHCFGRTYGSCNLPLQKSTKTYETAKQEYVFFHSQFPIESLEVVVEILAYQEHLPGHIALPPTSCGWAKYPCKKGERWLQGQIFEGSPRFLKYENTPLIKKSGVVEYMFIEVAEWPDLRRLIPVNCLCGPNDTIPGLIGGKLPENYNDLLLASGDPETLDILPQSQLYVNNCVIKIPPFLESRLLTFFRKRFSNEQIFIHERRLRVAGSNQWNFVNSTKLSNSIALSTESEILRCNGIPTVDHMYVNENMALLFQLEYFLKKRKQDCEDEVFSVVVGEAVALLKVSEISIQFDIITVNEEMHCNSEKSIEGTLIWTSPEKLKGENWNITLMCEISQRQGTIAKSNVSDILIAIEERKHMEKLRTQEISNINVTHSEIKQSPEPEQTESQNVPAGRDLFKPPQRYQSPPHDKDKIMEEQERFQRSPTPDKIQNIKESRKFPNNISPGRTGYMGATKKLQPSAPEKISKTSISFYESHQNFASKTQTKMLVDRSVMAAPSMQNTFAEAFGKEIPRDDQVILATMGEKQLFKHPATNFRIADIEEDRQDILKANNIILEFISIKPRNIYEYNLDLLPKKFAFSFKFYTFPCSYTESVTLLPAREGIACKICMFQLAGSIKNWTNVSSAPSESASLRVLLTVDPSAETDLSFDRQYDNFLYYLAGNLMKIVIWDAESKIPFGSVLVCLTDLLRRRDPIRIVKKEYDITNDNSVVGSLQMILQCIGRKVGPIHEDTMQTEELKSRHPPKGKTKVRSKPLTTKDFSQIPQLSLRMGGDTVYGRGSMIADEERRKASLVYAYKLHSEKIDPSKTAGNWYKQKILEDINKYRTVSRTLAFTDLTAQRKEENVSLPPIHYTLGECYFYPILYINPYSRDTIFSIFLYDSEARGDIQLWYCSNKNFSFLNCYYKLYFYLFYFILKIIYLLLIIYYLLFIIYHLLFIIYHILFIIYHLLFIIYHLLFIFILY